MAEAPSYRYWHRSGWEQRASLASHTWTAFLDRATKLRAIRSRLDHHLARIEAEGLPRFGPEHRPHSPAVRALWEVCGSVRASSTTPVLQAVEAFLAMIQPTAAQAAFVAQNR